MRSIRNVCTFILALVQYLVFAPAQAQTYPARPVRLITAGAGTFHDIVSRQLAEQLSARWGQAVVVENQPAAGLTIGTGMAARAAPDGYTILMSDRSALAVAPGLFKSLPYDVQRDFLPVTLAALAPSLLVVHPSVPATNLSALLDYLKRQPDEVQFASAGPATNSHITMEVFKQATGIKAMPIHYKGGAPSTTALLSGEVKIGFALLPSVLPHVKAGNLRPIVVTGPRRFPGAPEVPTAAEAGLPGFESEFWIGVLVPARTPGDIVAKLNRDIGEALRQPEMQSLLQTQGASAAPGTQDSFASFIASEAVRSRQLIQSSGIRAD
jgi:tripartite-type tricarboxylate transporter receptor subunit TctC